MKSCKLLWWLLAASVLVALAIGTYIALVDEEALRARFQQAAEETLGTTVTIAGPVNAGVWPTPHLAANDVRVGDAETRLADIDTVRLHVAISSLFSARPRVTHAGFSGVRVSALEREFSFADVRIGVDEDADRVTLDPISLELLGGAAHGRLEVDFAAETPRWDLELDLDGFELEAALQALEPEASAAGQMDFSVRLTATGGRLEEIERTLAGTISLRGEALTLHGRDLDKRLADFESTRRFGLLDAGAVLLAGPVGLVVSKGRDLARLQFAGEGSTEFRRVISDWDVQDGVARAVDVAAATGKNRIAVRGSIDFAARRFESLDILLLDRRGCAVMEQAVSGPFNDPQVEEPNAVETLVGPLIDLVETGLAQLTDKKCEVVYDGAVSAP